VAYVLTTIFDGVSAFASLSEPNRQTCVDRAEGEVDQAIAAGGRYTPPLTAFGNVIPQWVAHIAKWIALTEFVGLNPDGAGAFQYNVEEARKQLDRVSRGATIAGAVDSTTTKTEGGAAYWSSGAQGTQTIP
jgi:hypothetical protein